MTSATTMPAVFVGHGSPTNALETNRFTDAWRAFGRSVPTPTAIVAVSAHWYVGATAVTSMERPRTIHDFGGFPDELRRVQYPAPGDPTLATEIADLLAPTPVHLDDHQWGLDHGTWSVLVHMFPAADIPVVQLSIDRTLRPEGHVAIGAALAPLRQRGVLVMASGNTVHNLGRLRWHDTASGEPWNLDFDATATDLMANRPGDIAELERHPAFGLAHPSPDHLVPLYYLAGLASAAGHGAEVLVTGPTMGSLNMTSYVVR